MTGTIDKISHDCVHVRTNIIERSMVRAPHSPSSLTTGADISLFAKSCDEWRQNRGGPIKI